MIHLTMYSRPGCHLCERMKETIDRATAHLPVVLTVVDISGDEALVDRYGLEIPVLEIDGTRIAKYDVSEQALLRAIRGRVS